MDKYIMVGVGGFLGSVLRFWLAGWIYTKLGTRFPYGTFVINVSGSFLVGFILTMLAERAHLGPLWRYLIPIGFIGGYTTFSTFEWETFAAAREGALLAAGLNVILSVAVGFIAVWLGVISARFVA